MEQLFEAEMLLQEDFAYQAERKHIYVTAQKHRYTKRVLTRLLHKLRAESGD